MGLIAQIAKAAGVELQRIGSLELVSFDDTERFLATAASENLVVLGIEAFRIAGGRVIPDMDAIADFSSIALEKGAASQTLRDARRFIQTVGQPSMFFEFVLQRRNEM